MLKDIPYEKILENKRKYEVWVLRDVYDNSFSSIARENNVSLGCVISDYDKLLSLKLSYYQTHLYFVGGFATRFWDIERRAYDCYGGLKYVVAYFEKEYGAILKEYRNGEPGMPEQVLKDLPPLRDTFSKKTIASIIRLRETDGLTYAAIGKRLRMTKEKAEDLYNRHYHSLFHQLSQKLIKLTGNTNLHENYQNGFRVCSEKKKYDRLISDYPELCKNIIEANTIKLRRRDNA